MKGPTVSSQDREWQARNDADTLMRAAEIEADRARAAAARKVAGAEAKKYSQVAAPAPKKAVVQAKKR